MTAALAGRLDATFAALADPTRRAIVARLAVGDATVNELAEPFDLSLPGISKHLKVLERSGLIAAADGHSSAPATWKGTPSTPPSTGSRRTGGCGRSGSTSSTTTSAACKAPRRSTPDASHPERRPR